MAGRPGAREILAIPAEIDSIDPETGHVLAAVDLSALVPEKPAPHQTTEPDVLNGIAWDPDERVMFVTGKYWPVLYKIRLIPD